MSEGAAEWTKDQSDQITSLYSQLHGDYQKIANKELFGGLQLPYGDAHSKLMKIIEKQESKHTPPSGNNHLDNKIGMSKTDSAVGLVSLLGGGAAYAMGATALGLGGLLVAGALLLSKYYSNKPQKAH